MRVTKIELHDFRSYSQLQLDFEPGANVLVGPNGIGKTNIVEAIAYLATLGSHRVSADFPLVRSDAVAAVVRAQVVRGATDDGSGHSYVLEVAINPGRANRIQVAGSAVPVRDFLGRLRTVVFAPEDLAIVKGDPSTRRRFLDELLVQRAPRYSAVRSDYERVVKQRTALLRSIATTRGAARESAIGTLEVWDDKLASFGASLLFGRLSVLNEAGGLIEKAYQNVAPGKEATIRYDPRSFAGGRRESDLERNVETLEQLLRSEIDLRRSDEIARGVTLVGPHRDDVHIEIGGLPVRTHASHGECWSMALSLRLGSFELMRTLNDGAGDPVLILDDVFAELDESRRDSLVTVASQAEQVLVTAAVAADVPPALAATHYRVSEGTVQR